MEGYLVRKFVIVRLWVMLTLGSLPVGNANAADSGKSKEEDSSTSKTEALVADVSILSSMNEISDYRPGFIYIIVKNRSDSLITVKKIDIAEYPEFLHIRPAYPRAFFLTPPYNDTSKTQPSTKNSLLYPDSIPIIPGSSGTYGIYVEAQNQLRPGKHMLLFNVFLAKGKQGKSLSTSIPISHEFKVNAFGENEILGALQNAVTFLVLPGFIILIAAGLTWPWIVPEPYKKSYPEWLSNAKKDDLRFWVVAITFSLAMVWVLYPIYMSFTTFGSRNFLFGYGFMDITMMWTFSLFTGLLISATGWLGAYLMILKNRWKISPLDIPETLLPKVVHFRPQSTSWFKIATLQDPPNLKGFLIPKENAEDDSVWLIPFVKVLFNKEDDKLYDKYNENNKDITLADFLDDFISGRSSKEKGSLIQKIEWYSDDNIITIKKPMLVKEDKLEDIQKEQSVFYPFQSS